MTTYKVLYKMAGSCFWNTQEFDDKMGKGVMEFAESQWKAGATDVEVYAKARVGFVQIKKF